MDSVSEVDDNYEIQVEDYWHTHRDPETGRTLVDGGEKDLWDIRYFVGTGGDEMEEEGVDGMLEIVGLSVEGLAQEVIARRCEETGVQDPEAAGETIWAVRRAHEYHGTRTLRLVLVHSPSQERGDLRPRVRTGQDPASGGSTGPASGGQEPAGVLRTGSAASDPPEGRGHHHPGGRRGAPRRHGPLRRKREETRAALRALGRVTRNPLTIRLSSRCTGRWSVGSVPLFLVLWAARE